MDASAHLSIIIHLETITELVDAMRYRPMTDYDTGQVVLQLADIEHRLRTEVERCLDLETTTEP